MNSDLIKFIELCLADGVISEKEREVIFRKSKELGIPDDECEIILEGLVLRHGPVKFQGNKVMIEENYFDVKEYKSWFLNWILSNNSLEKIKSESSTIIKNYFLNEIDGSEKKGSKAGDYIKRETLIEICELKEIPEIKDTFWKKGIKGTKGSLESYFKETIISALQNERFICYLSGSKSGYGPLGYSWGDSDFKQMIEHYFFPEKELENTGWYAVKKNRFSIEYQREGVLFTSKSVYEFKEGGKNESPTYKQTSLSELDIDFFNDEFGYFRLLFSAVGGVFEADEFNLKGYLPRKIEHNNDNFIACVESIGMNDYTKRLLKLDDNIRNFIDETYNEQIAKLLKKENYLYGFGTKRNVLGDEKIVMQLNGALTVHDLALELFKVYLVVLTFRDSLLNLLLTGHEVELERKLNEFENSELGMSKFELKTLSLLKNVNDNIVDLKDVTEKGISELTGQIGIVIGHLDSLNDNTREVVDGLQTSNFINLVSLYQNHVTNRRLSEIGKAKS